MAMITYDDKSTLNPQPSVANANKVTDGDMNMIKAVINQTLFSLLGLDVDNWASSNTYNIGDTCCYDNKIYMNLTGTNTATTPNNDTTNWEFEPIIKF